MYGELLFRRLNYGKKDCHNSSNYKVAGKHEQGQVFPFANE
jgi:hypothetical protein